MADLCPVMLVSEQTRLYTFGCGEHGQLGLDQKTLGNTLRKGQPLDLVSHLVVYLAASI